jgi:hypothetical protein
VGSPESRVLKPKPPPAPEMVYAIGSMEYEAQQERLAGARGAR